MGAGMAIERGFVGDFQLVKADVPVDRAWPTAWLLNIITIGLDGISRCQATSPKYSVCSIQCIDSDDQGDGLIELWCTEWMCL